MSIIDINIQQRKDIKTKQLESTVKMIKLVLYLALTVCSLIGEPTVIKIDLKDPL